MIHELLMGRGSGANEVMKGEVNAVFTSCAKALWELYDGRYRMEARQVWRAIGQLLPKIQKVVEKLRVNMALREIL